MKMMWYKYKYSNFKAREQGTVPGVVVVFLSLVGSWKLEVGSTARGTNEIKKSNESNQILNGQ